MDGELAREARKQGDVFYRSQALDSGYRRREIDGAAPTAATGCGSGTVPTRLGRPGRRRGPTGSLPASGPRRRRRTRRPRRLHASYRVGIAEGPAVGRAPRRGARPSRRERMHRGVRPGWSTTVRELPRRTRSWRSTVCWCHARTVGAGCCADGLVRGGGRAHGRCSPAADFDDGAVRGAARAAAGLARARCAPRGSSHFSDPRAATVGESRSRVLLARIGRPAAGPAEGDPRCCRPAGRHHGPVRRRDPDGRRVRRQAQVRPRAVRADRAPRGRRPRQQSSGTRSGARTRSGTKETRWSAIVWHELDGHDREVRGRFDRAARRAGVPRCSPRRQAGDPVPRQVHPDRGRYGAVRVHRSRWRDQSGEGGAAAGAAAVKTCRASGTASQVTGRTATRSPSA